MKEGAKEVILKEWKKEGKKKRKKAGRKQVRMQESNRGPYRNRHHRRLSAIATTITIVTGIDTTAVHSCCPNDVQRRREQLRYFATFNDNVGMWVRLKLT